MKELGSDKQFPYFENIEDSPPRIAMGMFDGMYEAIKKQIPEWNTNEDPQPGFVPIEDEWEIAHVMVQEFFSKEQMPKSLLEYVGQVKQGTVVYRGSEYKIYWYEWENYAYIVRVYTILERMGRLGRYLNRVWKAVLNK